MERLARIRKAIGAGVTTGAFVYSALAVSGGHVDQLVALGAAFGAGIASGLAVYFLPNAPAAA